MFKLINRKPKTPPAPLESTEHSDRLDAAGERIDIAFANMQVLEWDIDGKLIEIKCGVKPANGASGKAEFKPDPKPA